EGGAVERLAAGQNEIAGGPGGVGAGARLVEVVGHIRGVGLRTLAVYEVHRLGHSEVEALAAGQREAAYEGLTDKLVGEAKAGLDGAIALGRGKVVRGDDEVSALGFVDGIEESIGAELGEG